MGNPCIAKLTNTAKTTDQQCVKALCVQAKVQEGETQVGRCQASLERQQTHNNQLQNALQATEAELQQANALTDAEHLQVTLLQEAAAAREAAVQLLTQQLQDAEQKIEQQGQQLQVGLTSTVKYGELHLSTRYSRVQCSCYNAMQIYDISV